MRSGETDLMETMETVRDFIFLGSKITADGDCSREIKKLAPLKKSYDHTKKIFVTQITMMVWALT